ncbi:MAG: helix-turn-helix transcriptional regulator [Clostridia bacterium]|nr:helix-turn-helix transcriptional regulator [Clostridia bacterium]
MFGRLLRDYRKKFKISQKTLAFLSGVDRSIISRIEKGEEQADTCVQAKIVNLILHYPKRFRYENASGYERGEQLGVLLGTLPPEMADDVYREIIEKLKEYVEFQIDLDIRTVYPKEIRRKYKRKRKYMFYKFGPPIE